MIIKPEFEGKLYKQGNSYVVTIPNSWIRVLNAKKGDVIRVEITGFEKTEHAHTDFLTQVSLLEGVVV